MRVLTATGESSLSSGPVVSVGRQRFPNFRSECRALLDDSHGDSQEAGRWRPRTDSHEQGPVAEQVRRTSVKLCGRICVDYGSEG